MPFFLPLRVTVNGVNKRQHQKKEFLIPLRRLRFLRPSSASPYIIAFVQQTKLYLQLGQKPGSIHFWFRA